MSYKVKCRFEQELAYYGIPLSTMNMERYRKAVRNVIKTGGATEQDCSKAKRNIIKSLKEQDKKEKN
jgi:hypothetical protein